MGGGCGPSSLTPIKLGSLSLLGLQGPGFYRKDTQVCFFTQWQMVSRCGQSCLRSGPSLSPSLSLMSGKQSRPLQLTLSHLTGSGRGRRGSEAICPPPSPPPRGVETETLGSGLPAACAQLQGPLETVRTPWAIWGHRQAQASRCCVHRGRGPWGWCAVMLLMHRCPGCLRAAQTSHSSQSSQTSPWLGAWGSGQSWAAPPPGELPGP